MDTSIISDSEVPYNFDLPPNTLQPDSEYTIKATVLDQQFFQTSVAFVTILTAPMKVIASIAGGMKRIISPEYFHELDASNSEGNSLSFIWSCTQLLPVYSKLCRLNISDASAPKAFIIASADLANYTFNIRLQIWNTESLVTDSTDLEVTVAEKYIPSITVDVSGSMKINPGGRVAMLGSIEWKADYEVMTGLWAIWTVQEPSINLSSYALSSITTEVQDDSTHSFYLNLIVNLPEYVFTQDSYTFQLSLTSSNMDVNFGAVTIVMNEPPSPGRFTISPLFGKEFETRYVVLRCVNCRSSYNSLHMFQTYLFCA